MEYGRHKRTFKKSHRVICTQTLSLMSQNLSMKRITLLLCILLFVNICRSQLLIWTPEFPKDNDNITITVDATKGNQGLLGFSGNVYVHIGVITNLSTDSTNWRYSKFTWGSTDVAAQATPAGTNKWSYAINNIRTFFWSTGR